ncbi:MAG: hypothetical protein LZF86_20032 [Nitrospira sp.]|nr:MAG: hypothetical protein LZF86_20032 [Nitrospira sp.]
MTRNDGTNVQLQDLTPIQIVL